MLREGEMGRGRAPQTAAGRAPLPATMARAAVIEAQSTRLRGEALFYRAQVDARSGSRDAGACGQARESPAPRLR
jgi:hypothetical protein